MITKKKSPVKVGIEEIHSPLQRSTLAGGFFNMTYQEKLQSPEWQKVRLRVMQRDKWKCILCGDHKQTLHVHHLTYSTGKAPWDYPISNFQTLCKTCHRIAEHVKGFKEQPTEVIYITCSNYTSVFVVMTGDLVLRYTFDESDQLFTSGGILTHEEIKFLTAKKRCKNAG